MKVLITGGTGQVGGALLAACPANVSAVAMSSAELDITDRAGISAALTHVAPDAVINAAAFTAVDRAEAEVSAAMRVNGAGVGFLAEACRDGGAQLIHLSSDFVFDGRASQAYRTDALPSPVSAYGRSKHAGELTAMAVEGNLLIRTAWVYAAQGSNFVRTMLRLMAERDEVRVVADQIGTPTHARSLAAAMWQMIALGAQGIYHFTDSGVASWYDFAVAIQDEALALGLLDRTVPIIPITSDAFPTAAPRPAFSVLDKGATWALLGRQAPHWRHELRRMLSELGDVTGA